METALGIIYAIGFLPFGTYWLWKFEPQTWDNDVFHVVALSFLWPLLLIPCVIIHATRRTR